MILSAGYENGWSYIPHMLNTPFYCYAYSFGDLLVKALYGMYRREGQAFIPKYKRLLASGGSQTPREQTKAIGVDIMKDAFWQIGFDELERLVSEAERLARCETSCNVSLMRRRYAWAQFEHVYLANCTVSLPEDPVRFKEKECQQTPSWRLTQPSRR